MKLVKTLVSVVAVASAMVGAHAADTNTVFLRQQQPENVPAVNVYIGGEYLTSLLPNTYRQTPMCAGEVSLSVENVAPNVPQGHIQKSELGKKVMNAAGATTYYLIVAEGGKPVLQQLPEEQGKQLQAQLKEYTYMLSRVDSVRKCPQ